jgi:hypothetical protein
MAEDVKELNVLNNSLDISTKPGVVGWPVSGDELTQMTSPTGLFFVAKDTLKRTEGKDEIWVIRYKVSQISLGGLGLSGNLPDLSFSDLVYFNFSR